MASSELVTNGKNAKTLLCQQCSSKILRSGMGLYQEIKFTLPAVNKSVSSVEEAFEQCFVVDDMYTFENVGFSKNVGDVKYLICADCESGPVGWHCTTSKKNYVALSRVSHQ